MHAVALKINSGFNVYKITNNNMRKKVFLRILHPSLLKRLTKKQWNVHLVYDKSYSHRKMR